MSVSSDHAAAGEEQHLAREHLERLMGSWGMLADLSFSDLLLYAPQGDVEDAFVVLGQMRPTTSQTLFEQDLVGRVFAIDEIALANEAWTSGVITGGEWREDERRASARQLCIPVRYEGEVVAISTRVWSPTAGRRTGSLERVYLQLFEQLARMVAAGRFPFVTDEAATEEAPRVGDGVIVLDGSQRVSFASPNAISALHRMGITSATSGISMATLGIDLEAIETMFHKGLPMFEEIERQRDVIVLFRCIPLIEGDDVTGAVLLLRDVTDVRRRDRLLLSKDAAIREVHHRVKNNLQTISSLLRLQSRRLDDGVARDALMEAERRVSAIALVHEILAHEPRDEVPFGEIVPALVQLARDANVTAHDLEFCVSGDAGELSADIATPLAVVIAELLQNAVEHASTPIGTQTVIDVNFAHQDDELVVTIGDNGKGFPTGFDIDSTRSLGLAIVRDLVRGQLGGTITVENVKGARITLVIPADRAA